MLLTHSCPSVVFRRRLARVGLKRAFLLVGRISSTTCCLGLYDSFFHSVRGRATLCCLSARLVRLTLGRGGLSLTHGHVSRTVRPSCIRPGVRRVHGHCLRRCFRRIKSFGRTCCCRVRGRHVSSSAHGRHVGVHATRVSLGCDRSAALVGRGVFVRRGRGRMLTLGRALCL